MFKVLLPLILLIVDGKASGFGLSHFGREPLQLHVQQLVQEIRASGIIPEYHEVLEPVAAGKPISPGRDTKKLPEDMNSVVVEKPISFKMPGRDPKKVPEEINSVIVEKSGGFGLSHFGREPLQLRVQRLLAEISSLGVVARKPDKVASQAAPNLRAKSNWRRERWLNAKLSERFWGPKFIRQVASDPSSLESLFRDFPWIEEEYSGVVALLREMNSSPIWTDFINVVREDIRQQQLKRLLKTVEFEKSKFCQAKFSKDGVEIYDDQPIDMENIKGEVMLVKIFCRDPDLEGGFAQIIDEMFGQGLEYIYNFILVITQDFWQKINGDVEKLNGYIENGLAEVSARRAVSSNDLSDIEYVTLVYDCPVEESQKINVQKFFALLKKSS